MTTSPQPRIITVSGLPGSGTTTLAETLSERLNATYLNGGTVFRALAEEQGMELNEFSKYVNENPDIDRAIDFKLRQIIEYFTHQPRNRLKPSRIPDTDIEISLDDHLDCEASTLVLESRLAGWIAGRDACLRIWCETPTSIRCDRRNTEITAVAGSNTPVADPVDALIEREKDEKMRYQEWYGIDITDTSIYDLCLNTARWNPEAVCSIVLAALNEYNEPDDEGKSATDAPFLTKYE